MIGGIHASSVTYLVQWHDDPNSPRNRPKDSFRTETHFAAWYSQPDSTGQICTVRNRERTLRLGSWYMLRSGAVSSNRLKKPGLSSCMPEVFRARGISCYRTSLQGTFHCPSAGIWNVWLTEGPRGGAVGWGSALRAGRTRVLFSMLSVEFFIDMILPAALWPWDRLRLQRKWVPCICISWG